jgi:DnaK suppressor protein
MTTSERMRLKAALEAKRLALADELRGRIADLAIEADDPDPLDWVQRMSDRDATASMLNRLSVTIAEVMGALRAFDQDSYGHCIQCERPIALKRLQSIPWAAYCVRCQEQIEAEGSAPDLDEPKAA